MSRRLPWMKWYPSDWRAETALRMCRRPARSFWIDLLGLMHESHRYGHLLINGIKPTVDQLARATGDSEREVRTWLAELESAGVYSKTDDGIVYSRRMVRDYLKAQQDAANGRDGGNPKITKRENGGVNPQPNPTPADGDKAQMLDARYQSPEVPPPPSGSAPRKHRLGSKLPEDWQPSDADMDYAINRGFEPIQGDEMAETFRVYWTLGVGRNKTHADWSKAWQTWVRKEKPKGPANGQRMGRTDLRRAGWELAQELDAADAAAIENRHAQRLDAPVPRQPIDAGRVENPAESLRRGAGDVPAGPVGAGSAIGPQGVEILSEHPRDFGANQRGPEPERGDRRNGVPRVGPVQGVAAGHRQTHIAAVLSRTTGALAGEDPARRNDPLGDARDGVTPRLTDEEIPPFLLRVRA